MPSKYKLTYFDGRGRAEPIRFILKYADVSFEDHRISDSEWSEIKSKTPFGKVPILEIDGKEYSQSGPLLRYLGRKAKLGGSNELEDLNIDIIADVLADVNTAMWGVMFEGDEDTKKSKLATFQNETLPFHLKKLENIAKQNGGYLANKKMSWADILFASSAENLHLAFPESNLEDYPTLKVLQGKILGHPKIKAYIAKRPSSPF